MPITQPLPKDDESSQTAGRNAPAPASQPDALPRNGTPPQNTTFNGIGVPPPPAPVGIGAPLPLAPNATPAIPPQGKRSFFRRKTQNPRAPRLAGVGAAPPLAAAVASGAPARRVVVINEGRDQTGLIVLLLAILFGGAFAAYFLIDKFEEKQQVAARVPAPPPAPPPVESEPVVELPPIIEHSETDDKPGEYDRRGDNMEIPSIVEPIFPIHEPVVPQPKAKPDAPATPPKLIRKQIKHVVDDPYKIPVARTIDAMVVYTKDMLNRFGGNHQAMLAHIDSVIEYTNRRFDERKVRARVRLVGIVETEYVSECMGTDVKADLRALTSGRVSSYRYPIAKLRQQTGADIVTLMSRYNKGGGGGLAQVLGPWAAMNYPSQAIYAHELRHNFGWNHQDKTDWSMIDRNAQGIAKWQPRRVMHNMIFVQYMGVGNEFDMPEPDPAPKK